MHKNNQEIKNMSKEENKRREARTPATQEKERAWEETRMPISKPDLLALVMRLDEVAFAERDGRIVLRCDCTLHYTRCFLEARLLPEEPIIKWLIENGGHCDCEVAMNVGGYLYDHFDVEEIFAQTK
jgi:hypothetical protein